jgi:hypothetical protein
MISTKYIGMDVHKESISIAVRNAAGKVVMECIVETKAHWQFWHGRSGRFDALDMARPWSARKHLTIYFAPVERSRAHPIVNQNGKLQACCELISRQRLTVSNPRSGGAAFLGQFD